MTNCKKHIEVAMPVKEISAESVRDKSIRHGHISTLHLWWARRPLPVCRAVVFASLVYDPLDENCPQEFRDAAKKLLSASHYKPYEDIPFTAAKDPLEDNLRNRLIAFIGKFSDKYTECEEKGKKCPSKGALFTVTPGCFLPRLISPQACALSVNGWLTASTVKPTRATGLCRCKQDLAAVKHTALSRFITLQRKGSCFLKLTE